MVKKEELFGITFDVLTMQQTVDLVMQKTSEEKGVHLLGVNADKILAVEKNSYLKSIVKSADIINADGASVVLASRILGKPLPERVAGIDLMEELLKEANSSGSSVYFIGASD